MLLESQDAHHKLRDPQTGEEFGWEELKKVSS